jgi:hypothetical protein
MPLRITENVLWACNVLIFLWQFFQNIFRFDKYLAIYASDSHRSPLGFT